MRIGIYGAKTLERYTQQILVGGFQKNGCSAEWITDDAHHDFDALIFQLHGSPQSENGDSTTLRVLQTSLSQHDGVRKVILLHRPDELQKFTELPNILASTATKIGLVFFGNAYRGDPFYPSHSRILKTIIPHGFFPLEAHQKILQEDPIVIGGHTTWGEMRSVEHALRLLAAVFTVAQTGRRSIIGYLGGKPVSELRISSLREPAQRINAGQIFRFLDVHSLTTLADLAKGDQRRFTILVDDRDQQPTSFSLTFNMQLYYLGNAIRRGESSGSAHAMVSIPVVLEMNGAEQIEDIRVVKIPYGNADNINSVDFVAGAQAIAACIKNGDYTAMLRHNLKQANVWDNTKIGRLYLRLFEELTFQPKG